MSDFIQNIKNDNFQQYQLTLGQLIDELKDVSLIDENADGNVSKSIVFDFGYFMPDRIESWRGIPEHLAIGYKTGGQNVEATKFLEKLESSIDESFEHYKGGSSKMTIDTPLWVANGSDVGSTIIIGIKSEAWRIVILTAYGDY